VKSSPREVEAPQQAHLLAVAKALHRRFDSTATAAIVDLELRRAIDKFAGAPIRTYVPILAEREVMDRLGRRTSARVAAEATADRIDRVRTAPPPADTSPGPAAQVRNGSSVG
jgi:hypothetical protein